MAKKKNDVDSLPSNQEGDLGKLLISVREKIGYSIPQTADAMCLSESIIKKLEKEEFDSLPGPPYIRGYLRNYAKLAEIEADELINCYESLRGEDPSNLAHHYKGSSIVHTQQGKNVSPILMQLVFLGFLLAALVGLSMIPAVNQWIKTTWDSFSDQTASQSINSTDNPLLTGNMPPISTPETPQAEIAQNTAATDAQKTVADASTTETKKEPVNNNTADKPVAETIKVGEENKNEAQIPASTDGSINIKLIFNKEVWMRIKDGKKKTVFEGQNASGQVKELTLKKPLTFRVGNAQGLSLFVDDKAVDISRYIKGSIANFTLE
ncbi:MAG: RodZ domain-containing protein [Cocleimonas sp.]